MDTNNTYVNPNSSPCPSCGYCPHCGRGGNYFQPYWSTSPWITYTYPQSSGYITQVDLNNGSPTITEEPTNG